MRTKNFFNSLITVAALGFVPPAFADVYAVNTFALGTLVNSQFKSDEDKAKMCAGVVNKETRRLEELLSAYIPTSDVSRLGEHEGKWIDISPDTAEVLQVSIKLARDSEGTFDPTVGPLVKLWSADQTYARVPADEEIAEALKNVDYRKIQIRKSEKGWQARLGKNQQITLGAIGKGFIADKVMAKLKEAGCENSLVSLGGNIIGNGTNDSDQPWRIGLQQPDQKRGAFFAVVPVADTSVVTSGDYEKFFVKDGVKYHHLLNPVTGKPVEATISSVTIVDPSSTFADAMCTGLFVMGWDKAVKYMRDHPNLKIVLVNEGLDKVAYSGSLRGEIDIVDPRYKVEVVE